MTSPPSKKPEPKGSSPKRAEHAPAPQKDGEKGDVVLVHGVTEDRQGLKVLRARGQDIEMGEVRPLKEGQALNQDVVKLEPRPETPYLCDVKTEFSAEEAAAAISKSAGTARSSEPVAHKGPAQVATKTYRDNWDLIWSSSRVTSPGSSDLN